jgi:hypothetical protein
MHQVDERLTERLRVDLLNVNPFCSLLQLLVPPIEVVNHDHNYACINANSSPLSIVDTSFNNVQPLPENPTSISKVLSSPSCKKMKLNVTSEERHKIEIETRHQSQSSLWFLVRVRRITGSKCGKILTQQRTSEALLFSV